MNEELRMKNSEFGIQNSEGMADSGGGMQNCEGLSLRAERSNLVHARFPSLDCFVASLLAMTEE